MASRTQLTDALLLRSVDYGDADRIVTLLTAERGKVSALARGARRSRRRFGGALEPYCLLRVELAAGRGELDRLAEAQVGRPFSGILRTLDKMMTAGAACELLRYAVPAREPDRRVFEAGVAFLEALDRAEGTHEELLLAFQARLLALVGFAPELEACARCGKRAGEGQAARFDPDRGAVVCQACGGAPLHLSGGVRERLRSALGAGWAEQPAWPEEERRQARQALDAFILRHMGKDRSR